MGLLEQVIGSVAGKGGKSGSGGMSPLAKALLLLLAAKAASSYMNRESHAAPAEAGTKAGKGEGSPPPSGKIESGVLAGFPSLDSILDRFRSGGHSDKVESWVGTGPNKPIQPHELKDALDPATLDRLERESGLSRPDLLNQLSTALPQVVDKLTPAGQLPGRNERGHW